MTPVEKLEAAIAELEELRADSTPGEWYAESEEQHYLSHNHPDSEGFGYTIGPDVVTEFESYMAPVKEADALLILTLHRTIDAQLRVLRHGALGAADMAIGGTPDEPASVLDAIDLADAILGVDA